jgi:hypothetical protein
MKIDLKKEKAAADRAEGRRLAAALRREVKLRQEKEKKETAERRKNIGPARKWVAKNFKKHLRGSLTGEYPCSFKIYDYDLPSDIDAKYIAEAITEIKPKGNFRAFRAEDPEQRFDDMGSLPGNVYVSVMVFSN